MITLREQQQKFTYIPGDGLEHYKSALSQRPYFKSIKKEGSDTHCYRINPITEESFEIETSYFIGVDWVAEHVPIHVTPKLDTDTVEIDYFKMLFEALEAPDNFDHLDELCEIDFDKPTIAINQKQDFLTPFLLIQYMNVLKRVVQKGLKKSYYNVTHNLNARVKGRILVNDTIKKNHANNKMVHSYCQYSEFGINSIENKVLKKALMFSISAIKNLKGIGIDSLNPLVNYIQPAFELVDSEVNIEELRHIKPNPLYKEYAQALKLARFILKKYGYNISNASSSVVNTPPFWIDMSKLFELYVFSKLKKQFTGHNEVIYHKKFNYLEPDFVLKSDDGYFKMVIDAKYKPQYEYKNVLKDDARQVSGYARLKRIYDFLKIEATLSIDCLIIYSNQNTGLNHLSKETLKEDEDDEYNKFFMLGLKLPEK